MQTMGEGGGQEKVTIIERLGVSGAGQQYRLDDIDRRIIAALRSDGRATNQRIARSLRIAPATVGARIRRLHDMNAMRVVAVSDFSALGCKVLLAIGIQAQGRPAPAGAH